MRSRMRIIRQGEEITLVSENGGRALAWLVALEVVLLGGLIAHLAAVLPEIEQLALPALTSLALIVWTWSQIRADTRVTMHLGQRDGRIVRIAPLTGSRTTASFTLDEVENMALRQKMARTFGNSNWSEYVVAVELRGGGRHVLSARGPLLAYHEIVSRFSSAAGVGARVVRLPAA